VAAGGLHLQHLANLVEICGARQEWRQVRFTGALFNPCMPYGGKETPEGFQMRVLTVSDIVVSTLYPVADRKAFGEIDLVIACGDLPPEYLGYLAHVFDVPLFFVKGNHDIRFDRTPPGGCTDLNRRLVSFRGLRFLGLEGSMWYNGGPCQYTEKQMKGHIRRLRPVLWWRKGVDVVVTHAPPLGVHDGKDLCHQGFACFRRLIRKYRPRFFLHGHIHAYFQEASERMTLLNTTRVINTYGYHVLDI
jgi:Icc-related predicted phosphoesterase